MKHTLHILSISFAVIVLTACSDILEGDGHADPTETLVFSTSLEDLGNAPMSRAVGGYTIMEMTDWVDTAAVTSRAAVTTSLSGYASVYGYQYAETFPTTVSDDDRILTNAKFTFSNGMLEPDGDLTYWSTVTKAKAFFCSYAPYGASGISPTVYSGKPGVTYIVPADNATGNAEVNKQTDVLYASKEVSGDYKQAIPFEYKHALTAIQFKMGFACTVKSISIQNVNTSGTFTFDKAASGNVWEESNTSGNYTISFDAGVAKAEGDMLTDGENTMMLIPQSFKAESEYTTETMPRVVLKYDDNGTEKTIQASLANSSWGMGKKIVYTLYNKPQTLDAVFFDLAAASVSIFNDTEKGIGYSGKVYVNGVATDVAEEHLTAEKMASTKFYVYQSSTKTGNYDKDHTGYPDAEHMAAENCRIPNYKALEYNGKSWSDYITNNTSTTNVTNNFTTLAEAAGRTPTATPAGVTGSTAGNIIRVNGDVTCDMTIDNLWSTFQEAYDHRVSGGFVIGPGDVKGGNKDKYSNRYEKVTLRLKGDNRFSNILYYGHPNSQTASDCYFKITSMDGNKSESGTLTVCFNNVGDQPNGACTMLGGGDDDDTPACNDMYFDGGTIFVGSPVYGIDNNAISVVGGGTNNSCNITINGGRLTSIAQRTTGSAIGGGGGFNSYGGNGKVTINGGKVFAYHYGVYSKVKTAVLASSAIGGGNSFNSNGNSATVTITGGEVYAECVGGVAIGGGSSVTKTGGDATLKITGGTVTTKSTKGIIYGVGGASSGVYTNPGTAIGGGNGTTGGTATFTMTGGTLKAGSIGGGKPLKGDNIGNATINISGGTISGQFILAKAGSATPSFTMTDGKIQNSSTTDQTFLKAISPTTGKVYEGGAVHMEQGTCTISGGIITGCSATLGGAVYMNGGTFNLKGGTISSNKSSSHGGAVYVSGGNVNVTGGTLTKNYTANGNGGAVYVTGGSFSMPSGSTGSITSNTANSQNDKATGNGGGIYVASSTSDVTAEIISGTVTNNTADRDGGGMYVAMSNEKTATITIGTKGGTPDSPTITGNSAALSGGALCVMGTGSNVTIKSGTVTGNVSAYQKNEDIRNDGGRVDLDGTTDNFTVKHIIITFNSNYDSTPNYDQKTNTTAEQRIATSTNSLLAPPSTATSWTETGYTITGWNTKKDGSGTTYKAGDTMNTSTNVQLYAIWTSTSTTAKRKVITRRNTRR